MPILRHAAYSRSNKKIPNDLMIERTFRQTKLVASKEEIQSLRATGTSLHSIRSTVPMKWCELVTPNILKNCIIDLVESRTNSTHQAKKGSNKLREIVCVLQIGWETGIMHCSNIRRINNTRNNK
jgi:hypothetical protein